MQITACEPLTALAADATAAAWLLREADPLRGYVEMLAALPPEPEAWREVLEPWMDEARRGGGPMLTEPAQYACIGALGVAAMRTSGELECDEPLAVILRHAARWCFFRVRAGAR